MIPKLALRLSDDITHVPEADLIARARTRDESAVRELMRRLNPRLFRVARGIVNNDADAEDVMQDAYLSAFTRIDQFRGESSFATWVTRIAINAAYKQKRGARINEIYDTVQETDAQDADIVLFPNRFLETAEMALGRHELRQFLEGVISNLPPDLRLVFLLREMEGLSILQIARDLEINPITVKTRIFRARRRLRAALEGHMSGGFESVFPFNGARCLSLTNRVVHRLNESDWMSAD